MTTYVVIRTDGGENAESIAEPRVSDPKPVAICHCCIHESCIGFTAVEKTESISHLLDLASAADSGQHHALTIPFTSVE